MCSSQFILGAPDQGISLCVAVQNFSSDHMQQALPLIDDLLEGRHWDKEKLLHLRAACLDDKNAEPEVVDIEEQDPDTQAALRSLTGQDIQCPPAKDGVRDLSMAHPEVDAALARADHDCSILQRLTGGHALSSLLQTLLGQLGLSRDRVSALASAVEESYLDNPYHNSVHAACVLHAMHHLLHGGGVLKTLNTVDIRLVQLAAYLAAAAHDMHHPGVTNAMLVAVKSEIALQHNDQSVCENHHLCELFKLLKDPELNILSELDEQAYRFVRSLMIHMVLRTDMQQHHQVIREGTESHAVGDVAVPLLMQMTLKVADLSHTTYPWPMHRWWVQALEDEFYLQGDKERSLSLPISPLMDRHQPGLQATQTAFLGVVVQPLLVLYKNMFPGTQYLLAGLQNNIQQWHTTP